MEIIPGLPKEISGQCLLRVTYMSHHELKAVSRSWEATLSSPQFYQDRKTYGTSEQFICLIQAIHKHTSPEDEDDDDKLQGPFPYGVTLYDPLQGTWDRLPSIPEVPNGIPQLCRCVQVQQKLILMGGWDPFKWETMNTVYIFDFISRTWSRGENMPTTRSSFACSLSPDGLIYIAGGQDNKRALKTAERYNIGQDKWEVLPPMTQKQDQCHGFFLNGKFNVISGYKPNTKEVFDPTEEKWSVEDNMWSSREHPTLCWAVMGHLYYFLDNQKICRYDSRERVSKVVDYLPECMKVARYATVWRDKIFVTGFTSRWGFPGYWDEQACYMYHLNSGKWVPIERPHDFEGFVQGAVTVEL